MSAPGRSIAIGWLGLCLSCSQDPQPVAPATPRSVVVAGYELGTPSRSFTLPHELREVSGIVAIDAATIACLQDEKGELFVFDLATGRVREKLPFGPKGDYEAVALDGAEYHVLRSDGEVLQLHRSDAGLAIARTSRVSAPQKEFEGLCFDPVGKQLVVAPKAVAKELGDREQRPLYVVDPATGMTAAAPLLVVDRDAVLAAAERLHVDVPTKATAKGEKPIFRLRFAEVAVQPTTGHLWLLSAVDRALIVVDRKAEVLGLHFFDASELPQPEGLTFLPGGELAIASEGAGGAAVLRVYAMAPTPR